MRMSNWRMVPSSEADQKRCASSGAIATACSRPVTASAVWHAGHTHTALAHSLSCQGIKLYTIVAGEKVIVQSL